MKKLLIIACIAIAGITLASSYAPAPIATDVYTIGHVKDSVHNNYTLKQDIPVGSKGDFTVTFQYTRVSDSVVGSTRLQGSLDGNDTTFFNVPGFENDTVIINLASIKKAWVVRKSGFKYYRLLTTIKPSVANVGKGYINSKLYPYVYEY